MNVCFPAVHSIDGLCVFVQVCELDIIFNFEKAYFILDEFLMGGEIQDTSKKSVLKAIEQADLLQEVTTNPPPLPWRVGVTVSVQGYHSNRSNL